MAYREIGMWEILEVLRRVARGEPQRAIQRATGHSRTTIRRWLRVARRLGWKPGEGEPDEVLAVAVAERARPVPAEPSRGKAQARLAPHREQIQGWLETKEGSRGDVGCLIPPRRDERDDDARSRDWRHSSTAPISDAELAEKVSDLIDTCIRSV